jgi:hypothetical protein
MEDSSNMFSFSSESKVKSDSLELKFVSSPKQIHHLQQI